MAQMIRLVLLGAALVYGASASAQEKPDWAAAGAGKVIYQRYCASCHGTGGKGDGPLASELRTAPPDLTRLAKRNGGKFPYDRVVRFVDGRESARAHGTSDMPVWGEVFSKTRGTEAPSAESAISRIAHYLWSIQPGASR